VPPISPEATLHRDCAGIRATSEFLPRHDDVLCWQRQKSLREKAKSGVLPSLPAQTMKTIKTVSAITLTLVFLGAPLAGFADDTKPAKKLIPDKMTTCPVSGEKLGGDMGKPYEFEYKGQEVKLCCSSCKKDFDKSPAKYMKKIRAADKEQKDDKTKKDTKS
jgi:YHS domain-containing protein